MTLENLVLLGLKIKGSQKSLSLSLGISESALSKKLNHEMGWTSGEIEKLKEITGYIWVCREEYLAKMTVLKYTFEKSEAERLL